MYKKIYNFLNWLCTTKRILCLFAIIYLLFLSLTCISITKKDAWNTIFSYPEKTYEDLEKEANRIAQTHNFETNYKLKMLNYSNDTPNISFELSNKSPYASLTVEITSYKLSNQK